MTYSHCSLEPPEVSEQLDPPRQMDTYKQYLILIASQVYIWQVPGFEAMLTVTQLCWAKESGEQTAALSWASI